MEHELAFLDGPLLPRTLLQPPFGSKAVVSEQRGLESAQTTVLMALGSSTEVINHANEVLNISRSSSDHENGGRDVVDDNKCQPQARRKALGRKRARFSMKPNSSQESANIYLNSKIEHITDPEEYFSAFEKNEIAEKELKKLKGQVSTDPAEDHRSRTIRQRRPGLLDVRCPGIPRKSASYKHSFPVPADKGETLVPSQEVHDRSNPSPSKSASDAKWDDSAHRTNCASTSEGMEITSSGVSVAAEKDGFIDKENRVNSLLDKLLSSFEDLDEEEGAALLKEHLQLKRIDMDRIRLPVTPLTSRAQRVESGAENSKLMGRKADKPQLTQNLTGPNRSPLAALSLLQKQTLHDDRSTDPYSLPLDDDVPCVGETTVQDEVMNSPSLHDDITELGITTSTVKDASTSSRKGGSRLSFKGILVSPVTEEGNNTGSEAVPEEYPTGTSPCSIDQRTENKSSGINNENDVVSVSAHGVPGEKDDDIPHEASIYRQLDPSFEDLESGSLNQNREESSASSFHMDDTRLEGAVDPIQHIAGNISEDKVNEILREEPGPPDSEGLKDPSRSAVNTSTFATELPESSCIVTEHDNETASRVMKEKAPCRRNKQTINKRMSLAEAGSKWESGLRRSTRHRMRPLETWRGERLLYARIHDSLATVIGVKYSSPGENQLKVKSYVSDEYKELVERAAWH